ncbi:MAG: DUF4492 domain-containing protein [Prevotella sp.]
MKNTSLFYRLFRFYRDGFAHMGIGRTLWLVVIVKLLIIFLVLKLFFMPDILSLKSTPGNESEYVGGRLLAPFKGN